MKMPRLLSFGIVGAVLFVPTRSVAVVSISDRTLVPLEEYLTRPLQDEVAGTPLQVTASEMGFISRVEEVSEDWISNNDDGTQLLNIRTITRFYDDGRIK
jgi:hypothetical protein